MFTYIHKVGLVVSVELKFSLRYFIMYRFLISLCERK